MPIFEYNCSKCGKDTEILTGVTAEKQEIKCEHCGSTSLKRKISIANFAVKGASVRAEVPPCGAAPGETCGHCQYAE